MSESYSLVTYLTNRLNALWQRVYAADAAGDEYHTALWMRLTEKLDRLLAHAVEAAQGR